MPAGEALGVDRDAFGAAITASIEGHPLIEVVRDEFLPEEAERLLAAGEKIVLATGPLTSPALAEWLAQRTGRAHLYFYDAVSPTVEASSLDRSRSLLRFSLASRNKINSAVYRPFLSLLLDLSVPRTSFGRNSSA